jgi:hypothetical protein
METLEAPQVLLSDYVNFTALGQGNRLTPQPDAIAAIIDQLNIRYVPHETLLANSCEINTSETTGEISLTKPCHGDRPDLIVPINSLDQTTIKDSFVQGLLRYSLERTQRKKVGVAALCGTLAVATTVFSDTIADAIHTEPRYVAAAGVVGIATSVLRIMRTYNTAATGPALPDTTKLPTPVMVLPASLQ